MNDNAAPRATRREWLGLAVLALPCLLYSMDLTVLNLAVLQAFMDAMQATAVIAALVTMSIAVVNAARLKTSARERRALISVRGICPTLRARQFRHSSPFGH